MPIVPKRSTMPAAPRPYGVDVFTDFTRNKQFPVLCFRYEKSLTREDALSFITQVIDSVAAAGLLITDAVKIDFTPDRANHLLVTPKTLYRLHLKVAVKPLEEQQQDDAAFIAALRQRFAGGMQ